MGRESYQARERAKRIASMSRTEAEEYLRSEKHVELAEGSAGSLERACSVAGVESEVCGDCEGKGVVLKTNGWMLFDGKCKRCSGTGRIESTKPLNEKGQR
jgi:DnaJ-class molecular chaperone